MENINESVSEQGDSKKNRKAKEKRTAVSFMIRFFIKIGVTALVVLLLCLFIVGVYVNHNGLIHIHRQMLCKNENHKKEFYFVPYTKDEWKSGNYHDGREFPLSKELAEALKVLEKQQEQLGIKSEFIFVNNMGKPITTAGYTSFFARLSKKFGFKNVSNHTLRRSINSKLSSMGFSVAECAKLLGNSEETNLKYYTYPQKDYLVRAREALNKKRNQEGTKGVIPFTNEKSPQSVNC